MIDQLAIGLLGVSAILLSQSRNDEHRRYACLVGIAAQPFWFYATYTAEQWGIFILSFFYTAAWARGVWNYWIAPALRS
jgi:hypothetical protein